MIFHTPLCDFSAPLCEVELDRLNTVKAFVLTKFKTAMLDFGKPEIFRTEVMKAVKAKNEVIMARAIALVRAEVIPAAAPAPAPAPASGNLLSRLLRID